MTDTREEEGKEITEDVVIPKFIYHEYEDKNTGMFRTAITPNSKITELLKALGWTFSPEGVDLDPLIGNWVEVNVNDYEQKATDGNYTASGIAEISPYKGPPVKEGSVKEVATKEPAKIEKQLKHEEVKKASDIVEAEEKKKSESEEELKIRKEKDNLKQMLDDGLLTQKGYDNAIEQLGTEEAK